MTLPMSVVMKTDRISPTTASLVSQGHMVDSPGWESATNLVWISWSSHVPMLKRP